VVIPAPIEELFKTIRKPSSLSHRTSSVASLERRVLESGAVVGDDTLAYDIAYLRLRLRSAAHIVLHDRDFVTRTVYKTMWSASEDEVDAVDEKGNPRSSVMAGFGEVGDVFAHDGEEEEEEEEDDGLNFMSNAVVVSTSTDYPNAPTSVDNVERGDVLLSGYWLQRLRNNLTLVTKFVHVDLHATVMKTTSAYLRAEQAEIIGLVRSAVTVDAVDALVQLINSNTYSTRGGRASLSTVLLTDIQSLGQPGRGFQSDLGDLSSLRQMKARRRSRDDSALMRNRRSSEVGPRGGANAEAIRTRYHEERKARRPSRAQLSKAKKAEAEREKQKELERKKRERKKEKKKKFNQRQVGTGEPFLASARFRRWIAEGKKFKDVCNLMSVLITSSRHHHGSSGADEEFIMQLVDIKYTMVSMKTPSRRFKTPCPELQSFIKEDKGKVLRTKNKRRTRLWMLENEGPLGTCVHLYLLHVDVVPRKAQAPDAFDATVNHIVWWLEHIPNSGHALITFGEIQAKYKEPERSNPFVLFPSKLKNKKKGNNLFGDDGAEAAAAAAAAAFAAADAEDDEDDEQEKNDTFSNKTKRALGNLSSALGMSVRNVQSDDAPRRMKSGGKLSFGRSFSRSRKSGKASNPNASWKELRAAVKAAVAERGKHSAVRPHFGGSGSRVQRAMSFSNMPLEDILKAWDPGGSHHDIGPMGAMMGEINFNIQASKDNIADLAIQFLHKTKHAHAVTRKLSNRMEAVEAVEEITDETVKLN
jgi:hypothetical protein